MAGPCVSIRMAPVGPWVVELLVALIVAFLWDWELVCGGLDALFVVDGVVAYIVEICLWRPGWAGSMC